MCNNSPWKVESKVMTKSFNWLTLEITPLAMSMQLQYSHTIQVYIVILWLEKTQPNVWKMQTRAVSKCLTQVKQVVQGWGLLRHGFDLIMQDWWGEGGYIYISH